MLRSSIIVWWRETSRRLERDNVARDEWQIRWNYSALSIDYRYRYLQWRRKGALNLGKKKGERKKSTHRAPPSTYIIYIYIYIRIRILPGVCFPSFLFSFFFCRFFSFFFFLIAIAANHRRRSLRADSESPYAFNNVGAPRKIFMGRARSSESQKMDAEWKGRFTRR